MLVLGRRERERVVIEDSRTGEEIEVVVTSIGGGKVKLGFIASQKYNIYRKEIGVRNQEHATDQRSTASENNSNGIDQAHNP